MLGRLARGAHTLAPPASSVWARRGLKYDSAPPQVQRTWPRRRTWSDCPFSSSSHTSSQFDMINCHNFGWAGMSCHFLAFHSMIVRMMLLYMIWWGTQYLSFFVTFFFFFLPLFLCSYLWSLIITIKIFVDTDVGMSVIIGLPNLWKLIDTVPISS